MSVHDAHDMISTASRHLEGIYDACGPAVDANVRVAMLNRQMYLLCTEDRIFVTFVPLVHWQTGEHIPMFPTTILELFCTTDADLDRILDCLGDRPQEETWNRATCSTETQQCMFKTPLFVDGQVHQIPTEHACHTDHPCTRPNQMCYYHEEECWAECS
ncbi:hypothetical protein VFPFJ_05780 [Purpureocillium lilacinum]|uniref:Uncharacterized protein n=1 Tax=Purpureocillium lilacinum TaxID=33203 RepID=A0A179HIH7_PURLI|nr:hypothetical protein VFPFJ_05780 [Purpureocillium lilacinum]OAQ89371.1 hypothetical protein VFPFJ_05780 [Purpureocillium lilacinum]